MKAFVEGWITMSGPSSAKAGMQGNSDSSNGSNCIYDEMIDELTDGDGSNRTEYWKMILMKVCALTRTRLESRTPSSHPVGQDARLNNGSSDQGAKSKTRCYRLCLHLHMRARGYPQSEAKQ